MVQSYVTNLTCNSQVGFGVWILIDTDDNEYLYPLFNYNYTDGTSDSFGIWMYQATLRFNSFTYNRIQALYGKPNTWHYFSMVIGDSGWTLYVDGTKIQEIASTGAGTNFPVITKTVQSISIPNCGANTVMHTYNPVIYTDNSNTGEVPNKYISNTRSLYIGQNNQVWCMK